MIFHLRAAQATILATCSAVALMTTALGDDAHASLGDAGVLRDLADTQMIVEQDFGTALLLHYVVPHRRAPPDPAFSSRQPESDRVHPSRVRLL
jgi:azurin